MDIQLYNSITDVPNTGTRCIAISGSHGGVFPATVASTRGVSAAIFHDAGIGYQSAGIAGIILLDKVQMAAIAIDSRTAFIGNAQDTQENGVVSFANSTAEKLGVFCGMRPIDAIKLLKIAPSPQKKLPPIVESRSVVEIGLNQIICCDSASLISADDDDAIIVTGSHGGLIGGDPKRALKARARLAVFNDAGFGKNNFGVTRLPALDERNVGAVTVSHESCRIGDAHSAIETGRISAANERAASLGAKEGMALSDFLKEL